MSAPLDIVGNRAGIETLVTYKGFIPHSPSVLLQRTLIIFRRFPFFWSCSLVEVGPLFRPVMNFLWPKSVLFYFCFFLIFPHIATPPTSFESHVLPYTFTILYLTFFYHRCVNCSVCIFCIPKTGILGESYNSSLLKCQCIQQDLNIVTI